MGGRGNDWIAAASRNQSHGCADEPFNRKALVRQECSRKGGSCVRSGARCGQLSAMDLCPCWLGLLYLPTDPKGVPSLGSEGMAGPVKKWIPHLASPA